MSQDALDALRARTKKIMGAHDGHKHDLVDDLIDIWGRYYDQGLSPNVFANTLFELSLGTMLTMAHLDDAEAFARFVRDGGEQTRKIITENWPPPDRNAWPYTAKK